MQKAKNPGGNSVSLDSPPQPRIWTRPSQVENFSASSFTKASIFDTAVDCGYIDQMESILCDKYTFQIFKLANGPRDDSSELHNFSKDEVETLVKCCEGKEVKYQTSNVFKDNLINATLNAENGCFEDLRSFLFSHTLQNLLPDSLKLSVIHQLPIGNQKCNVVICTTDLQCPAVIMEWKNSSKDSSRAFAESLDYGYKLQNLTKPPRTRFLHFIVLKKTVDVLVHVQVNHNPRYVTLEVGCSFETFCSKWIPVALWFTDNSTVSSELYGKIAEPMVDEGKHIIRQGDVITKTYDYTSKDRRTLATCDRRRINYHLVGKFYPKGTNLILNVPKFAMFRAPTCDEAGDFVSWPFTVEQCRTIVSSVLELHKMGYVHGDIRQMNMLFSRNRNDAYLIDFDFSDKPGTKYPTGFRVHGLETWRHPEIEKNNALQYKHDVYSLQHCLSEFVEDFPQPDKKGENSITLEQIMNILQNKSIKHK
eukprot:m.151838 g.151838  ORF g.151838 m.151838 type:complete len:478 (-) comp15045_c1_seq3:445-1878(-)